MESNFISLKRVTKKGNPLTNITLAVKVTFLFHSYNALEIEIYSGLTLPGFRLTVFPFKLALSGPKRAFALAMSCKVRLNFLTT